MEAGLMKPVTGTAADRLVAAAREAKRAVAALRRELERAGVIARG